MKKKLLMLAVMLWGTSPVFGMEIPEEDFDIRAMTPIKEGLPPEQRREVIQSFLKESLKPEYEFDESRILSRETRKFNGRTFTTCLLDDGSLWVQNIGGLERFLGYLYLKKAIEHYDPDTLCAIETRFAYRKPNEDITIRIDPYSKSNYFNTLPVLNSNDFCTYSRYVKGSEGFTFRELESDERKAIYLLQTRIRFTDIKSEDDMNKYKNMKRTNGKLSIYDTEYRSFEPPPPLLR